MNANLHPFYRHSGKLAPHGPLMTLGAGAVAAIPLGVIYAYLIKWIPFIYLNVFITAGYGFGFGFLTGLLLKAGDVRNNVIAALCGLTVGVLAWYFAWSGYVHSLVTDSPWILWPRQVKVAIKILYEHGSWGLGFSSSEPVTGFPLAVVWIVEGAMIVGLCTIASYAQVSGTPFCERNKCWLDQDKIIDKLDAFVSPTQIAAFQAGDLSPLEQARPRVPAYGRFARLTIKHSARCDEFCTLTIANVTTSVNKDGKTQEKVETLASNLEVPKTMFDYLAQFDHASATATSGV
jgi:hypothetical protein